MSEPKTITEIETILNQALVSPTNQNKWEYIAGFNASMAIMKPEITLRDAKLIVHNVPGYIVNPHEDTRIHRYSVTESALPQNELSGEDAFAGATTPRQETHPGHMVTTPKVERNDKAYQPSYKLYPAGKRRTHFARPNSNSLFVPASPNTVGSVDTGPATFLTQSSPDFNNIFGTNDHDGNPFSGFNFNSAENGKTDFFSEKGKPNFVSSNNNNENNDNNKNNNNNNHNNGFGSIPSSPQLHSNEVGGNNYLGSGLIGPIADFTSNGEDGNQPGYNYPKPLPPVISKSVYVHIAPPDEEIPRQKVIVPKVPPKKNYQIVFIRPPTPPPPTIPIIPPFPPQSDKTLIYVLHPKLEEAPPIRIPPPPENTPIKPEVYFIRYKSRKEINNESEEERHRRRYGRRGEDGEGTKPTGNVGEKESKVASSRSEVPHIHYQDDQSDSSGESSNIIQVYAKDRGKNAH